MNQSYLVDDMSKIHYEILGIEPTASPEDIRSSYLRAIAYYHPDRNKSKDAVEMTRFVNQAYDTLKDPRKKNDYVSMLITRLLTGDPQQTPPQDPEPPKQKPESQGNGDDKEEKKQEEIEYSSVKQGKFIINLFIALILLIPIMYIMNICQG